jgi:hypothetical protein
MKRSASFDYGSFIKKPKTIDIPHANLAQLKDELISSNIVLISNQNKAVQFEIEKAELFFAQENIIKYLVQNIYLSHIKNEIISFYRKIQMLICKLKSLYLVKMFRLV